MFIISKTQWNAIQKNLEDAYVRTLVRGFRKRWPDNEGLSQTWIKKKAEDAKMFGLKGRYALKRFFELCISEGSDFPHGEKYSWASKILRDKKIPEGAKLDHIEWTLTMREGNES